MVLSDLFVRDREQGTDSRRYDPQPDSQAVTGVEMEDENNPEQRQETEEYFLDGYFAV